MVKPSTVMKNCPSMDKKSSPRSLRAFRIRFGVDKLVKKVDPSSATDSLKQYGESSSIRSSSSSLIHFSSSALVLEGGGARRAFHLAIRFADILPTTGSPGNASGIKARARCGQLPCKRS